MRPRSISSIIALAVLGCDASDIGTQTLESVCPDRALDLGVELSKASIELEICGGGRVLLGSSSSMEAVNSVTMHVTEHGELVADDGRPVLGISQQRPALHPLVIDQGPAPWRATSKIEVGLNLDAAQHVSAAEFDLGDPVGTSDFSVASQMYLPEGQSATYSIYFKKIDATSGGIWEAHVLGELGGTYRLGRGWLEFGPDGELVTQRWGQVLAPWYVDEQALLDIQIHATSLPIGSHAGYFHEDSLPPSPRVGHVLTAEGEIWASYEDGRERHEGSVLFTTGSFVHVVSP